MKTLLTLLLTLTPYVYAQHIHIPDPNLDAAIRQALNLPADTPITETDMARLTRLEAENLGIQDVVGISLAVNLERLYLSQNPIENLYPLAPLEKLERLRIAYTNVSDISVVEFLTNLREFHFHNINVSDPSYRRSRNWSIWRT